LTLIFLFDRKRVCKIKIYENGRPKLTNVVEEIEG